MEMDVCSVSLPIFTSGAFRDGDVICSLLLTRGIALL